MSTRPSPHAPPCSADVGTAATGPKICGRNSRHFARCADSASNKHRAGFPCCGICARKLDRIGFEIFRGTTKDPVIDEMRKQLTAELGAGNHLGDSGHTLGIGEANDFVRRNAKL